MGLNEWTTPNHTHWDKEYLNGDQASITKDNSSWIWEYSDSAGKILRTRASSSFLEAKAQSDNFNSVFPENWDG